MDVEIEETGPVQRVLKIAIPTADVDAAFDRVYRGMRKGARIPGFRPGKVPRGVIERYFGERARSEVLEQLVQESLPRAVEQESLQVVGDPQLRPGEPPMQGEPFCYEATFDLRPEIELAAVKGLEITRPALPEPEEDPVERHLEELRMHHAQVLEEDEDVASARGHQAVIDYEATVDGKPFDGGSGTEVVVELGDGRAIPGLEDELIGMSVGQQREFELLLPESYPGEAVQGKTARFSVKLVGLKRRELPDLDDELAKDVSDFETLAELRADLTSRIAASREREQQRQLREAAVDALIAANPFPVPGSMVERQLQHRLVRAANQLSKLPEEELRKLVEGWREEWRPQAERDVRLALLVPEIAESEQIEVPDEDLDAQLKQIAEQRGQPLSQVKRSYQEQGLVEALRGGLLEERVVDFLVAEATVSET